MFLTSYVHHQEDHLYMLLFGLCYVYVMLGLCYIMLFYVMFMFMLYLCYVYVSYVMFMLCLYYIYVMFFMMKFRSFSSLIIDNIFTAMRRVELERTSTPP